MTIDKALKITSELRRNNDVTMSSKSWEAYYKLLEDALMRYKYDSSFDVGEYCVELIECALEGDMALPDKVLPYCRRHVRYINDNDLLYCVCKIRQQPDSRRQELEQYGWIDFLDFLESEQLRRQGGE